MALYVRRDQEDSELRDQITRNLQDKHKAQYERNHQPEEADLAAGFKQGTKETSPLSGVWIFIIAATVGVAVWIIIISN